MHCLLPEWIPFELYSNRVISLSLHCKLRVASLHTLCRITVASLHTLCKITEWPPYTHSAESQNVYGNQRAMHCRPSISQWLPKHQLQTRTMASINIDCTGCSWRDTFPPPADLGSPRLAQTAAPADSVPWNTHTAHCTMPFCVIFTSWQCTLKHTHRPLQMPCPYV